jgi:2-methylisocitrate lyase-like PEP mutase family enzyme
VSEWGERQEARAQAAEAEAADRAGVSIEDYRAAKRVGMEPSDFVAYSTATSLLDVERIETEKAQRAEAKREAAHRPGLPRPRQN